MEKLLKAIKPFTSDLMKTHLEDRPDDTVVAVEVAGRNGYRLQVTLGDLRNLWTVYESYQKHYNKFLKDMDSPTTPLEALAKYLPRLHSDPLTGAEVEELLVGEK